jgi:hypothetical protein
MPKRRATKEERHHMANVAALGCILCGYAAEVHHLTGAGMGRKSSNFDVMPLCAIHHRIGGYGVAVHAGTKAFEAKYGTQAALLEKTRAALRAKGLPDGTQDKGATRKFTPETLLKDLPGGWTLRIITSDIAEHDVTLIDPNGCEVMQGAMMDPGNFVNDMHQPNPQTKEKELT